MRRKPKRCKSDLSRDPVTLAGQGPLPCEKQGEHQIHERWSPPIAARWEDKPAGGRHVFEMRSAE